MPPFIKPAMYTGIVQPADALALYRFAHWLPLYLADPVKVAAISAELRRPLVLSVKEHRMKVKTKTETLRHLLRVTCAPSAKTATASPRTSCSTAAGETLTAMTFDMVAGTLIVATAQVTEDGAICLPAKKLQEIVSKLPDYGDMTITADTERWKATISCGNYRGNISGMDPTFMPRSTTMEDLDEDKSQIIKIQTKGLDRVIKQVSTFVQDEKKATGHQPHRCAGDLQQQRRNDDELRRRASLRAHHPGEGTLPDSTLQLIMPRKQLNEFANLLDDSNEAEIGVTPTANRMIFRVKPNYSYSGVKYAEIASQLLAGPYPTCGASSPRSRPPAWSSSARSWPLRSARQRARRQVPPRPDGNRSAGREGPERRHDHLGQEPARRRQRADPVRQGAGPGYRDLVQRRIPARMGGPGRAGHHRARFAQPQHPALFYPNGVDARTYFYVCMPMGMDNDEEEEGEPSRADRKAKGKGKKKGKAAAAAAQPAAQPAAAAAAPAQRHSSPRNSPTSTDDEDGYDPTYELEAAAA